MDHIDESPYKSTSAKSIKSEPGFSRDLISINSTSSRKHNENALKKSTSRFYSFKSLIPYSLFSSSSIYFRLCNIILNRQRPLATKLLKIFQEGIARGEKDKILVTNMKRFLQDDNHDYGAIISFIQNEEAIGNIQYTCMIAYCYEFGIGIAIDAKKAFYFYKKAAFSNDPIGQFSLGLCYYQEKGVAKPDTKSSYHKDDNECFFWMQKSAESGFARGQCSLGYCYVRGIGTLRDEKKSLYWFQRSAEAGCALGQANLGLSYEKGIGTEKNFENSFYWYIKSANGGNSKGQCCLGLCYDEGIGVNQDRDAAFHWFYKSAYGGNTDGQYYAANCYLNGRGTPKDERAAIYWYRRSAEEGDADGESMVAYCHRFNWGTSKDIHEAIRWFRLAANNGNITAREAITTLFYTW